MILDENGDPIKSAPVLTKERFERVITEGLDKSYRQQADNFVPVPNVPAKIEPDWYRFFGRKCTIGGERGRLGMTRVYAINPGPNNDYENGKKLRICLFYPNRVLEGLTV